MAEAIGAIASVYTIAEGALKVGSTLWKLGKDLKGAGNEVREVSKRVRLIAKTLREIYNKCELRSSVQDLSLIDDLVSVCEDRLSETRDLVEALEDEMIKGKSNGRLFLLRLKFVFEKSKFALLQQDLDSLQVTLQLVVETMTFEQSHLNGQATQELRDELEHLKDTVEQDIMDRQTHSVVQLALSLGDSNPMSKPAQLIQNDDATTTLEDESAPIEERQKTEVAVVTQTFTQLEFSKSLTLFAQTQLVQKKAIRRADYEIKKSTQTPQEKSFTSRPSYPMSYESLHNLGTSTANNDSTQKFDSDEPILSPTLTNMSEQPENMSSLQNTRTTDIGSSHTQSSTVPFSPQTPNRQPPNNFLIPPPTEALHHPQRSTASISSFSPDNSRLSFSILDITGQRHRYTLSRLDETPLPNLILEANRALLYLPPKNNPSSHTEMFPHKGTVNDGGKDSTSYFIENSFYRPPPRTSTSSRRFTTLASRAGISRAGAVDISRDQLWGRYVLEYAKWHTCQAMYKELERKAYFVVNMSRVGTDQAYPVIRGHINEVDMTKSMSLVHCTAANWDRCVEPSAVVAVAFDVRSFDRTDMFDTGFTDFGHVLDDDLYINDLRALKPPAGQSRLFSNIASAGPRLPW